MGRTVKHSGRVVWAALVCAGALATLLTAWFVAGWDDVRARQREIADQPNRDAAARRSELSRDLGDELHRLVMRETTRPYYHYSNLFHDPRLGDNLSVTPSPLASGPGDALIRGHFQIDSFGRVSTPTINDEVPQLSEQTNLPGNTQFRNDVARFCVPALEPPAVVAARDQRTVRTPVTAESQVLNVSENAYVQNTTSNEVWRFQNGLPANPATPPPNPRPPNIAIVISPFEWRTVRVAGEPTLVAVRTVETPDGAISQGFVVDRTMLTKRLAERADDAVAVLRNQAPEATYPNVASGPEIAPGWYVDVAPNPRAVIEAASDAAHTARTFVFRFVTLGALAAVAFAFVVWLVARAEQLARQRSQFAAAAAHELRTPLAGLQLYGDMVSDGLGDPAKLRDYARRMSEEAARLGRVVSNVLGFSQLERGNLSITVSDGDLGSALRELAERAQPALDRAGAALDLDVPLHVHARFDRDALARIVGNLLDNAEKYSRGADDRTIGLTARSGADGIEVVVTDRGPGVAPAARSKLFTAFARGVTSDGPAGLGLGLALSRSLAHAMGGELSYRAEPTGASFVLRLAAA